MLKRGDRREGDGVVGGEEATEKGGKENGARTAASGDGSEDNGEGSGYASSQEEGEDNEGAANIAARDEDEVLARERQLAGETAVNGGMPFLSK